MRRVVGEKETIGVGSIAIEKLPGAMVDAQSVLVDSVTSATVTSTAILAGAKDCVEQAGMADTFCVAVEKAAVSTEVKRYEADVVVVGGGMSGMSAALSAANNGASVFLMEKLPMTGGNAKSAAGNYMVAELPENGFQVSDVPDTLANVFQENNSPIDESESSYYRLGANRRGERYQNEAGQYATQLLTLTYGGEHPYYALYDSLDERVTEIAESGLDCGAVIKGETLEELAQNAGFDKDTFLATVARYNEMCEKGVDDDFGKDAEHLKAVGENGPYYLVEMCPAGSDTLSGVKTDANFRALNADGQPIEGLYAVGSMSLGIFYNQYYFSGSALTFSATSGRIAGADAAQAD